MDNDNSGNPVQESEGGFDWNSPNLFDAETSWLDKKEDVAVEPQTSTDEEVAEPEGDDGAFVEEGLNEEPEVEQPVKKRPLDPEQQSFKDRYYILKGKLEALEEQSKTKPPPAKDQQEITDDLETIVREGWGEDKAILKIVKEFEALKRKFTDKETAELTAVSTAAYDTIENFVVNNPILKDNPEIGAAFIDDIQDRLPPGMTFGMVVEAAQSGKINPQLAASIKAKLDKALAVATGKGLVDKTRQTNSAARAKQRSKAPSKGLNPQIPVVDTGEPKYLTYAESLRAARFGGTR